MDSFSFVISRWINESRESLTVYASVFCMLRSTNSTGGAVSYSNPKGNVNFELNSFHSCICERYGGAVYVWADQIHTAANNYIKCESRMEGHSYFLKAYSPLSPNDVNDSIILKCPPDISNVITTSCIDEGSIHLSTNNYTDSELANWFVAYLFTHKSFPIVQYSIEANNKGGLVGAFQSSSPFSIRVEDWAFINNSVPLSYPMYRQLLGLSNARSVFAKCYFIGNNHQQLFRGGINHDFTRSYFEGNGFDPIKIERSTNNYIKAFSNIFN